MSAWMLLPFAFGALSFVGVSVFKKIRQARADAALSLMQVKEHLKEGWKYTVAQRSQLPPVTGIPAIDKAIADGGLKAGWPLLKNPNVTFDLAGVAALDKMKDLVSGKERALQAKASGIASGMNPCGEIPLDVWQGDQFVQNETSHLSGSSGNVSKFKLQHKPIPGTTTGTVYVRNPIQTQNVAVATFVAHANGNLHFTPIGTPKNAPHWGHYENGEFQLEWPSYPGSNYIVCSYEYSPTVDERWNPPVDDGKSFHTFVRPPIDAARWAEIKKTTQHKEFSGETGKDDFFIPEDGKNVIRLLPPLNGPFHVSRRQHYGSMNGGGGAVQCTKRKDGKNWVGECPICEYYSKLWNDSSEARSRGDLGTEQQLIHKARQLKPVERHYYNVLVNGEVKMFSAGKGVHDQLVALICGDDQTEAFGDISNPATGRNVTLIKEMKGPFPDYRIIPHREPTVVGTEPEVKSIMEKTYNLETVAKKWEKSPEELAVALQKMLGNDYVAYQTWKNRNEPAVHYGVGVAHGVFPGTAAEKMMPFYDGVRKTIGKKDKIMSAMDMGAEVAKNMEQMAGRAGRSMSLEQKLKIGEISEEQYQRLKKKDESIAEGLADDDFLKALEQMTKC